MKKNIHLNTYSTNLHCISCGQNYQVSSISAKEIKLEVCSNCHPYYNKSSSNVKIGKVSAFEERFKKTVQLKKGTKN